MYSGECPIFAIAMMRARGLRSFFCAYSGDAITKRRHHRPRLTNCLRDGDDLPPSRASVRRPFDRFGRNQKGHIHQAFKGRLQTAKDSAVVCGRGYSS